MSNGMFCRACLGPLEKRGKSYTCAAANCDFNGVLIHRDELKQDPEPAPIAYAYQEPENCGDEQLLDLLRECRQPDDGKEIRFKQRRV